MNKPNDTDASLVQGEDRFIEGNGEMAQLIRTRDWSDTPLGPISSWPQSLRTTVSLCLASNFPIDIVWGAAHTQIYNDAYRIICGDKHPASLGMDYRVCWASAWPAIGKPFEEALEGHTSFLENQRMFLFRNGYLEETFFTFSLSRIRDESGDMGGLFHPVIETTVTMVGERRTRAVRDLTARLADAGTRAEVFRLTLETLSLFDFDLPFVLTYTLDAQTQAYRLDGCTGIAVNTILSPEALSLQAPGLWPMARLLRQQGVEEVSGIRPRLGGLACGPYEEPPDVAFAMPIWQPGSDLPVALLMAGASSRLALNHDYRGFYELLSAAFRAALARVIAYEEERKRASMLAAIDRAKTLFFSNVSHELRTPLTLILGPLEEALEARDLPAAHQERLGIANRNALRLLKLVNSLLDFLRIEAGRADADFRPTDLAALTAELASNFRWACLQAGLELVIDCPALKEPVWVDHEMWEKVVLNLLSNAFKFTLAGSIRVALHDTPGGVELMVADTGVGIPAAELPRIFDRFHRVDGRRGRSVEGTGIGLALVRELVQLHGGQLAVESVETVGTVLRIGLPRGTDHLPPDQLHPEPEAWDHGKRADTYVQEALRWLPGKAAPADALIAGAAAGGAPSHIILAEDNADMRDYVRRILEEAGYRVDAVNNGAAALAAAQRLPLPDLVLSDVMMPDMDGFALLQALRANPATAGVLIMLLSARAGEEARREGLAAGADDYMVKPFSARELRARVDGAIALARQRRQAAEREQRLTVEVETERARSALLESEAHVASLFQQTAAGIVEADLAGKLIRVNDRFCRILGQPAGDLIGRHLHDLIHPDDLPEHMRGLERMMKDGKAFEIDGRYLRPDGTVVWASKAVTPIFGADNATISSVLAVILDITGRKKVEQALREADRRKDEFLAMLAHELRNPLAPISAAAELMGQAQVDPARVKKASQVIARQVKHMTSLVDDLLDVSRVTRGLVTLHQNLQDMKTIVSNAVEQVRPLIELQRHHLDIDLADESAQVLGDHKRLVQVLTNLLNNAAKYTPPGGHIRLAMGVHDEAVVVSVSDDGIGIAAAMQPRVFDLFAQAERTSDRSQGGLGLGLALVRSLVELHGGTVGCHSDGDGRGSRFTVCLPRAPGDRRRSGRADDSGAQHALRTLRIMVVDDNIDAAQMLAMLLEASGHEVAIAYDPIAALARAPVERPDVFLLDIGLPGMDGNELARRLKAQPETSNAVMIAVTGYGQARDRGIVMDAGFSHHFTKPVDMQKLTAVLEKLPAT